MTVWGQSSAWSWAQGCGLAAGGYNISTDANGNSYVIGAYQDTTLVFGTDTLTNSGQINMFFVKYNSSGQVIWSHSLGGTVQGQISGITIDANGNVYITGGFASPTIAFGSDTLTNSGAWSFFVAKYDSSGNVIWAQSVQCDPYSAQGQPSACGRGIITDAIVNIYITGYYTGIVFFGPDTLVAGTMSNIFTAKFDPAGNAIWAVSAWQSSQIYGGEGAKV